MTDLLKLAERVEAATGPDRELDAAIMCARGASWVTDGMAFYGERGNYTAAVPVQPFTASLDAAMTLLEQGWGYEQRRPSDEAGHSTCRATIWWVPNFPEKQFGKGATPALALTAAALRAHAAMKEDK